MQIVHVRIFPRVFCHQRGERVHRIPVVIAQVCVCRYPVKQFAPAPDHGHPVAVLLLVGLCAGVPRYGLIAQNLSCPAVSRLVHQQSPLLGRLLEQHHVALRVLLRVRLLPGVGIALMAVPAVQERVGRLKLQEEAVEAGLWQPCDIIHNILKRVRALDAHAPVEIGRLLLIDCREMFPADARNDLAGPDRHQKAAAQILQVIIHCKQHTPVVAADDGAAVLAIHADPHTEAVIAVRRKSAAVAVQADLQIQRRIQHPLQICGQLFCRIDNNLGGFCIIMYFYHFVIPPSLSYFPDQLDKRLREQTFKPLHRVFSSQSCNIMLSDLFVPHRLSCPALPASHQTARNSPGEPLPPQRRLQ